MGRGFVSEILGPPEYEERVTPAQWRQLARIRLAIVCLALIIDASLVLWLRNHPSINAAALYQFAMINVPLLLVSALVSFGMIRSPRLRSLRLLAAIAAVEMFTIVVWIQTTGSLTSYFAFTGALLLVAYRLYTSYAVAAVCVTTLVVCHGGAIALETLGVLEPAPLFRGFAGNTYAVTGYQILAALSVVWTYMIAFVASNAVVNKLRAKDAALARVEQEAVRAEAELRHGRLSGTTVADEYALGEVLGRGGMGEVYAARRISNDTRVAVKILHGHLVDDATVLERFAREAQLARRIPAEYAVAVHDVGSDDHRGIQYIAMELLRGEDLGAYFRRHVMLEPDTLVELSRALAAAVDATHDAGVVHRDLKPPNIFLTGGKFQNVKLLDFGMGRLTNSGRNKLTQTHAVIGTVGYLAPEQALGNSASVGPAADRFAFASVVYRGLTGRPPFQSADLVDALREVVRDPHPRPSALRSDVTAQVDDVLALGLAKSAAHRYERCVHLVDDLERAFRGALPATVRQRAARLPEADADTLTGATMPTGA